VSKIKFIIIASFLVIIFSCIAFFFVPSSLSILSFSGKTFFGGEVWRLATYPFAHVNLMHLIENIIALLTTVSLAYEFGLRGKEFITVFLLSGIVIALAEAFLFPVIIIAGLSLGIYAVLGSLSIKGSNFIPKYILIPLLGISVFLKYLFTGVSKESLQQSLFHFAGFVSGIAVFYLLIKTRKKKKILQGG
jgi:membrane associated rhomboid family serine protease